MCLYKIVFRERDFWNIKNEYIDVCICVIYIFSIISYIVVNIFIDLVCIVFE